MEQKKRRLVATESLIGFTEFTYPRYRTASFHRQIAAQLERVERGEVDRLMLSIPPRHGKSELASRRYPAWYLGRHPDRQFISASATMELASDFGRDVRNLIDGMEYRALFHTRLAEDSQAKGKWHTGEGGVYYAVGIGGAVLGRGGHVILIDDPFPTMEAAQSEIERKRVWDWYTGTVYNRLMPGGAIIVISHRMHEEDLSGRLLAAQAAGGDKWEVVELPALSLKGKALWPEAYPADVLERYKRNMPPRYFEALYQQRPAPESGDYFKRDWIKTVAKLPDPTLLNVYGGSDYAVTSKGGDYTVHAVIGVDPDDRMYLLDLWRKQASSGEWVEAWCNLVKQWKPGFWAEELVQITSGVGPFLEMMAREKQAYTQREQFPVRFDKAVRAQSMRGRMQMNGLYVQEGAPWLGELLGELMMFPNGKHDDQVDALGLVGQLLDKVSPGIKPSPEKVERKWRYQPASEMIEEGPSSIKLL